MNLTKKIAIGLATVSLASGLYAIPVFAATEAGNSSISDDSFADSEAYDNDAVSVLSTNSDNDLLNIDASLATTGLNSQNGGEDGNELYANYAHAEYETSNYLNVNEAIGQDGASATNTNISNGSDGDAIAEDNDVVGVTNSNIDTDAFNLTASLANTGLNSQNGNEDGNSIGTGYAVSLAQTSNVVNHNVVSSHCGSTVCGVGTTTATAANLNISGDSFADSEARDNDVIAVNNTNANTDFVNATVAVSNSGLNFQNGNEDGNTITTGATGAQTTANNYVNVNETTVGGNSAKATNTNITDNSDGDATAESNTTLSVTNTNANTDVTNISAAISNSGGNSQNGNEDGNKITTGTAVSTGTTTNVVNGNQVHW